MAAPDLHSMVTARREDLVRLRRDLHQYPELGFEEQRTANLIAERLANAGLEVTTGVARTGVVGVLRGERPGKTLIYRADIDALPIDERTGLAFRSERPGVMHA